MERPTATITQRGRVELAQAASERAQERTQRRGAYGWSEIEGRASSGIHNSAWCTRAARPFSLESPGRQNGAR